MIITTATGARYLCDVRGCPHAEETTTPGLPAGWKLKRADGRRHADLCGECSALFNQDIITHDDIGWMRRQPITRRDAP